MPPIANEVEARQAGSPDAGPSPRGPRAYGFEADFVSALLLFLGLVLAAAGGHTLIPVFGSARGGAPLSAVDPNVAPWWELTALPEIGEATARAIVEYRESALTASSNGADGPPFTQPADLDRVPGIGPKTVARIAPYLRFDSP